MASLSFGIAEVVDGLGDCTIDAREQAATYFDTETLALTRAGASLRFRSDDGWTVKLPRHHADRALVRDELVVAGDEGEPPRRAADLVRAWSRSDALVPIARCTRAVNARSSATRRARSSRLSSTMSKGVWFRAASRSGSSRLRSSRSVRMSLTSSTRSWGGSRRWGVIRERHCPRSRACSVAPRRRRPTSSSPDESGAMRRLRTSCARLSPRGRAV